MPLQAVTLSGKRVLLRPPALEDYKEFTTLLKKSRRFHRGVVNPFKGRQQFAEYVQSSSAGNTFRFLICRNPDGIIVGGIGLFQIVRLVLQNGAVGYMVGAPFARQGFATEALQLLLRFAFKTLKLHRVEANIQPGNVASIALARRAGFKREGYSPRYLKICGRWRDHERWAILVEDWRRRNSR